jgi:aspartate carbamoyltransferase catalytic subunit
VKTAGGSPSSAHRALDVITQSTCFLEESDFNARELEDLLRLAAAPKTVKYAGTERPRLTGKEIALIFEKSSTRTRSAFEVAAYDQGAHVTYLDPTGSQLGHKESIADTAHVLGRMYDGIEFRGSAQRDAEELAANMHESSHRPYDSIAYTYIGRRPQQRGPVAAGDGRDHGRRRPDLRPARALAPVGRARPRRGAGSAVGIGFDGDRRP